MVDLHGKKWVYWLNLSSPSPNNKPGETPCYRVSIVVANESGHYPTGGGDKEPWYWDEETCKNQNKKLGYSNLEAFEIVSSSMSAQQLRQGKKSFR